MSGQAIVTIRDRQWICSVASTYEELTMGLSGVPSMPTGTGMLFILPQQQIVTVTAEGMLFPLSVIFIDNNLRVTEVALLLAPGDEGTTSLPCRYFLEVNVGEADSIQPGDVVSLQITQAPGISSWITPVVTFAGLAITGIFMAKMSKIMADAVLGKPKEKLALLPKTEGRFKPGEIVLYKGERVRVSEQIGDRVNIFIPSRQELVWVKPEKLERIEKDFLLATEETMEYRVEENKPYGTWVIVELFPGGTVRSPFSTKEEAIKREEEIGEYYGWKLKRVEFTPEEIALLDPQRFPKRTEALHKLKGYDVIHVHDDGDLTVRSRGKFYVVTTEGQTFEQKEYLTKHLPQTEKQYVEIITPGQTSLTIGSIVSLEELQRENKKARERGETPATARMWLGGKPVMIRPKVVPTESDKKGKDELEFLPDSPEFLAYTIEDIGYREKIDSAFQQAIARVKNGGGK
jgi:uncharacterized membrane protein (UPF0127 family)